MEVSINIPFKPYLKKYIQIQFGEKIYLSERNWLGILILNILKRKSFKNNYDFKALDPTIKDSLTVITHEDKSYRYGCVLLPTQIYYLNSAIDDFFKRELIKQALVNQNNYGIDFKTTINNFLEAHDITEDDLNYQSIRKYFNRNHRKFKSRMIL